MIFKLPLTYLRDLKLECCQHLVTELLHNNLRRGAGATRASVTTLICLLTRNNPAATQQLNQLLYSRLLAALNSGDQILAPVRSVSKHLQYSTTIIQSNDKLYCGNTVYGQKGDVSLTSISQPIV